MLYRRNLDYFSNRVGSASSAQHFPARIQISHYLFFVKMIAASFNRGFIWRRSRYIYVGLRRGISVKLNWFLIEVWRTQKTSHRAEKFWVFLNLEPGQPWDYGLRRLGASSFPWKQQVHGRRIQARDWELPPFREQVWKKDTGSVLGRIQARDWEGYRLATGMARVKNWGVCWLENSIKRNFSDQKVTSNLQFGELRKRVICCSKSSEKE